MPTLTERAETFRDLHRPGAPFVLVNVWDPGTARMAAGLGAQAVATTSAGFAFTRGYRDWPGETSREAAIAHAREIVDAVAVPVSADLEDGFGPAPEDVAETVRQAAEAGLAGCTIEDTTGDPERPIHAFDAALARVEAGIAAARAAEARRGRPFLLTARSENFLNGRPDLDDTLARLQAFEAAGADVLFAPGLPDLDAIARITGATSKPFNALPVGPLSKHSLADFAAVGVARVSLGAAPARVALGAGVATFEAALAGRFESLATGMSARSIEDLLARGTPD